MGRRGRNQTAGGSRPSDGARQRTRSKNPRFKRDNVIISLCVFAVALVCAHFLAGYDARAQIKDSRSAASWQETTQGSHVISTIQTYVHVTEVWENLIRESDGQVRDFDQVSSRLFEEYGAYLQSLVIAPGGTVAYVYPSAGNEGIIGASLAAIGHDDSYQRAVETGEATVSGVSNSTQGGQAFSIFTPVYVTDGEGGTRYWGTIEAVVRFPMVFSGIGFDEMGRLGYEYRLSRTVNGVRETIIESDNAKLDDPVDYTFEVPNDDWTLSLEPINGWRDQDRARLVAALLTIIAAALGGLTYFVLSLRERQSDYQKLSYVDSLTGLSNIRGYEEGLASLQEGGVPYALFAIDVNDFKNVNDTYGHNAGNVVLERLGQRLAACVRSGDIAYRVGGDEFAVVARNMKDLSDCAKMAARIRTAADQADIIDGNSIVTSVSVGYARYPSDGDTHEEVSRKADAAMYRDKKLCHAASGSRGRSGRGGQLPVWHDATDGLTGLPSIDYYRAFCLEAANALRRDNGEVAVAFIDVEGFKVFNLHGGYELGDRILKGIADLLREEFPGMLCARFDADHFVVMAPADGIEARLDDLHERARSLGDGNPVEVKAGIYILETDADVRVAHDRAKLVCDRLKGHFDRHVAIYDEGFVQAERLRQHVASELDRALEEGWIEVWYQPIMRTMTGRACGAEALARWHDPEFGEIAPDVFVRELERVRRVDVLDSFVAGRVCEDMASIRNHWGAALPASINISRADFELMDVRAMLEDAVSAHGIERSSLIVEITESADVGSEKAVHEGVSELRAAGFKVWVDDFGTGHSTANLLLGSRYNALKIDREFLMGVESSKGARDMVASVTDLAKRLSMQTVVEGVETVRQLAFAREMGIDMTQGYLFCKPKPLEELMTMESSGDIVLEPAGLHDYYDAIGHVNLLGQSPLTEGEPLGMRDMEDDGQPARAFGVIETKDGESHVIEGGPSFVGILGRLGIAVSYDPEQAVAAGSADGVPPALEPAGESLLRRALATGDVEMADFFSNGAYGTCRARHVASCGDRHAFVLSVEIVSGLDSLASALNSQQLLQHLYQLFDRIDVFDPAANIHRNIYASRPYRLKLREGDMHAALSTYAARDVHPDDADRWLDFFDFDTAERRINDAGGCVSEYFRTLGPAGSYVWQAYYLLVVRDGDRCVFLTCAKNVNLREAQRALALRGKDLPGD